MPLWGAVAPTSARRTSFHKEVVKHYLELFVDAVALVVDHCLHSIWELFVKALHTIGPIITALPMTQTIITDNHDLDTQLPQLLLPHNHDHNHDFGTTSPIITDNHGHHKGSSAALLLHVAPAKTKLDCDPV